MAAGAVTGGVAGGRIRWTVCALLLLSTTINYVDRQVIGILKPTLVQEFGWSDERTYAAIVFRFSSRTPWGSCWGTRHRQSAYVLASRSPWCSGAWPARVTRWPTDLPGFTVPALVIDAKLGFSVITLTGAAAGFALMRFLLGLGEAANFPASIKAVAEWFPKKERALATGIFNSGSNIGALLTPLIVPWVALAWGWDGRSSEPG